MQTITIESIETVRRPDETFTLRVNGRFVLGTVRCAKAQLLNKRKNVLRNRGFIKVPSN